MTMFRLYSSIVVINFVDLITSDLHVHVYEKKYASWQLDSLVVKTAYSVRHERH